ncbi:hypothetical protein WN944_007379 [Citrus x changshan-huyou]|uniref:Uncharacterized protein n=1 Tax=Citrus x changshan-huyou TaxID=2935761 RepID=A0AAP0MKX1_9ROSI
MDRLAQRRNELQNEEKQLDSVKAKVNFGMLRGEELSMDYESNKLQFDLIRRISFGYLKDLKEKKKHFYSFKTGLEDRLQDLEAKERQFEESVKEFKLREKSLILSEKQLKITVKICKCPALLVLDVMSGTYPSHSREETVEFNVAGEWKKKMRVAVENSLEVLGLLHLLAVHELAPTFDGD